MPTTFFVFGSSPSSGIAPFCSVLGAHGTCRRPTRPEVAPRRRRELRGQHPERHGPRSRRRIAFEASRAHTSRSLCPLGRPARENATFLKATIEQVPLPDNSVDVVISNCVINLAKDKEPAWPVLPGRTLDRNADAADSTTLPLLSDITCSGSRTGRTLPE